MRVFSAMNLNIRRVPMSTRPFLILLTVLFLSGYPTLLNASVLSDAAAALKPGQWVELNTNGWNSNMDLIDVTGASGSTLATDWSDNLCWAPTIGQVLYLGAGHLRPHKFIRYRESDNTWYGDANIPACFKDGGYGCFTHGYDIQAIDPAGGRFFYVTGGKTYQLNLATETWSILNSRTLNRFGMALDYFQALGILVIANGGGVYTNEMDDSPWTTLASGLVMGPYHNKSVHSGRYKKLFFGGGNYSSDLYSMDTGLNITKLPNAPGVIHVAFSTLTTDPLTGQVLYIPDGEAKLYAFDPEINAWIPGPPPPFINISTNNQHALATPIPEYGVTFFATKHPYHVYLYKHAGPNDTLAVTSIEAMPGASSIELYLSTEIRVLVTRANGSHDTTVHASYLSLDPEVASVSTSGKVTGKTVGTVRVQVGKQSALDTVFISVVASTAVTDSVRLNVRRLSLNVGEIYPLHAVGYFHKGAETFMRDLDTVAVWVAQTPAIASATGNLVRGVASGGPANIIISHNGKNDTCRVTVMPTLAFVLRVNFQCGTLPYSYGWTTDNGAVYSDARGFGWVPLQNNCRNDRSGSNFLLKSFVWTSARSAYKVKVPDGEYIIKIGLGDNTNGGNDSVWNGSDIILHHEGVSNLIGKDTVSVTGGNGLQLSVFGRINYIVIISKEGIDIDAVADDQGDVVPVYTEQEGNTEIPQTSFSFNASPNPFNPGTRLSGRLSGAGRAPLRLDFYDIQGKRVDFIMVTPAEFNRGVIWNASSLSTGIYYAVLKAGNKGFAKKLVFTR